MAVKMLKDGRWIVYYKRNGKQKKEYFGRGSEGKQAAYERDRELGFKATRPRADNASVTFHELAGAYLLYHDFASERAKEHCKIRLTKNIFPQIGHMAAIKLSDGHLSRYVKTRRAAADPRYKKKKKYGIKDATIHRELTDIKAILNWAAQRQPPLIPFNPVRDFKKPAPDPPQVRPPTAAEVRAIYDAASEHVKRAIITSYYTGLRPAAVELLSIRWSQVFLETKTLYIHSAQKGRSGNRVADRAVPIHNAFIPYLAAWRSADKISGAEFLIHHKGKSIKQFRTSWKNTLRRAGVRRQLRPYDLRHQFITEALAAGADIGALAKVVGSSPETIRKFYQHVADNHRVDTVAKITPLDFGKPEPDQ